MKKMRTLLAVTVTLFFCALCSIGLADTFTVTTTADSGAGTLRQAITDANASNFNIIVFNIPGTDLGCNGVTGVCTITPVTQLPTMIRPVSIDGYTQPGSSPNTLPGGDNAVLRIEISGAALGNNGNGLVLGAIGISIRGLVMNHGWSSAILIQGSTVSVEGCFLGTDATGTVAIGNTRGVNASDPDTLGLTIGGISPGNRNLISGNAVGIFIGAGTTRVVQGNFIGTNAAGTAALANAVAIDVRSGSAFIGGTDITARNVIAGDGNGTGISAGGPPQGQILIQGNLIGTDVTGTVPLGFANAVILTSDSSGAQVGGFTATPGSPPGNVITASFTGVFVSEGASNNKVQGNLIGTDGTGTRSLGNQTDGVNVQGAFNLIGGVNVMARNIISGNSRHGIVIGSDNAPVHDNLVQGNFIGTDITGTQLLGNGNQGVLVTVSTNNTIGGIVATAGAPPANIIAGNGGSGIDVMASTTTGVAIEGNSIFSNAGLGIDLNSDGVTPNDTGDPDTGPNNLQNYPIIRTVTNAGNNLNISGTLNSAANTTYRLEFFANNAIDPTGFGEGQTFVGSTNVITDAMGNASFDVHFSTASAAHITSTATDPMGNTSEFSAETPIPTPTPRPATLGNISTRLQVGANDRVMIAGFIVQGSAPKRVLIRAAGPSLTQFGVPNALANPRLELHDTITAIGMNDDWQTTQIGGVITSDQVMEIQNSGLAPRDPLESAIIATLAPGSYTAIVEGVSGGTGVGIVEVYDLSAASGSLLANISTRGFVQTGDNAMIGGFIVVTQPTRVIIRAIGPSLTQFGVPDVLANPQLELHDATSTIARNDDWQTTQIFGIITSDQVAEIQNSQLAPTNPAESAIIGTLQPGSYTAIVRGVNNTTGNGLVEVYALQ